MVAVGEQFSLVSAMCFLLHPSPNPQPHDWATLALHPMMPAHVIENRHVRPILPICAYRIHAGEAVRLVTAELLGPLLHDGDILDGHHHGGGFSASAE